MMRFSNPVQAKMPVSLRVKETGSLRMFVCEFQVLLLLVRISLKNNFLVAEMS